MKKLLLLLSLVIVTNNNAVAENKVIRIASGSVLESYYNIGLKICRYIELSNKGLSCEVMPTRNSVENLELLRAGKVDLALTQANVAIEASKAKGFFVGREKLDDMQQVLNLHEELFTVIVKKAEQIRSFQGLEGKKLAIGEKTSGGSLVYEALKKLYNFDKNPEAIELSKNQYVKEFCEGRVSAIMFMGGYPNTFINYIAHNCDIEFIEIDDKKISALIKDNSSFKKVTLLKNLSPNINILKDQEAIAVSAILVTKSSNREVVQNFLNYFSNNIKDFKQADPLLDQLPNEHFTNNFVLPRFEN